MLLVVHAAVTWALVGLILTIQAVHYPLFSRVGRDGYAAYQREHVTRVTWLVAPLMLVELVTGGLLALRVSPDVPAGAAWLGLTLIVLIWLSTALIQSPLHGRLRAGPARAPGPLQLGAHAAVGAARRARGRVAAAPRLRGARRPSPALGRAGCPEARSGARAG